MDNDDPWAEKSNVRRLSTSVPGLGLSSGLIDRKNTFLEEAAEMFDRDFDAPFWPDGAYPVGPFKSMVDDINGRWGQLDLPAADILSFWPNWFRRLVTTGRRVEKWLSLQRFLKGISIVD